MPHLMIGKTFGVAFGLASILIPGLADAECACTCVRNRPVAICQPAAMVEPICQQLCTEKVEQSLNEAGGSGLGADALSASPSRAGNAANAAALRALGIR